MKLLCNFFLIIFLTIKVSAQWSSDPNVNNVICQAVGAQGNQNIISDGSNGAIITWQDPRNGNKDIYAQRINSNGIVQWSSNGEAICTETEDQQVPVIVDDGSGGAIISWIDSRNGGNGIYAQRINSSGVIQWTVNGVAICEETGTILSFPAITNDGSSGAIISWEDSRSGNNDIYAQRVNSNGVIQWTTDGIAICNATGNQQNPDLIYDGSGGAIIVWTDYRGSDADLYAQRINSSGIVQWTSNGEAISSAMGAQFRFNLVNDGVGGAIVTWYDFRGSDADIYAQRINSSGVTQWTTDGVIICGATGQQYYPTIVGDGNSGAIITWEDGRGSDYDIYAQRINSTGVTQWASNGKSICFCNELSIFP